MSWFSAIDARFEDVPREGGTGTKEFLAACAAIVPLFGEHTALWHCF